MKAILINLLTMLCLTSCTYSVTLINTEGTASDVVDETDSVTPSTSVTIPVKAI